MQQLHARKKIRTAVSAPPRDLRTILFRGREEIESMFASFSGADAAEKQSLAYQVFLRLGVHMDLEEELIFPRIEFFTGEKDTVIAMLQRHKELREMMSELQTPELSGIEFDAKFAFFAEEAQEHFAAEENFLMPLLEENIAAEEKRALGREIIERRVQLVEAIEH